MAVLRDSTVTLDSLWRASEATRALEVSEAREAAGAAQRRFERLAGALPEEIRGPIVAAHTVHVDALETELAAERERASDLARRLSVSAGTVRLLHVEAGLLRARDSLHVALVRNLERRLGGNVSVFGFRFHVRCGLGAAAGVDIAGRANAVIGLGCAVGR
ncbi:hypothetical protein [Candidatus Palauibacter sp.]|uniref:hypothetical protein n=1 Tax=Candidatus Palauibacter sp. TaxID=3101350 RepID=UPI003CC6A344